jgi:uncharacterized protein YggT (Ycf19 family)
VAQKVQNKRPRPPKRKKRYKVTFDESVTGTLPMRTYRSPKPLPKPKAAEVLIRAAAMILSVLLILRLVTAAGLPETVPVVKALNELTNPLIMPFRLLSGSVFVATFFALVFVWVLAPILIHRFRDQQGSY